MNLLKKIVDENTIILIKGDMYSKPIIELAVKSEEEIAHSLNGRIDKAIIFSKLDKQTVPTLLYRI